MKHALAVVVGLALSLGVGSAAVHAESYPPGGPSIAVPDSTPAPGENITVDLEGFCANDVVTLTIAGPGGTTELGTVTVDGSGAADFQFDAPSLTGVYTIEGTGTSCPDYVSSLSIVVSKDGIPSAGSDSTSGGIALGVAAVALGALLVVVAAFRRRQPAAV